MEVESRRRALVLVRSGAHEMILDDRLWPKAANRVIRLWEAVTQIGATINHEKAHFYSLDAYSRSGL